MKKLKELLFTFIKEDFNLAYYLSNGLFLALLLVLNYAFDLEDIAIEPYKRKPYTYFIMYLYYIIPFAFSILTYFWTRPPRQQGDRLDATTIKHIVLLFSILSVYVTFYHHKLLIEAHLPYEVQYLCKIITNNFISAVLMFGMTYLYWRYIDDRPRNSFYGFTSKGVNLAPYFWMILIMVPLIFWASLQADFLRSYPIYYPHHAITYLQINEWIPLAIFEFNYGFDFVATELFFRGLLVIGLSRYMGSACIIPMVTTYCVFHFGKPLGEAASSILGGYILGVFAYKTRSIYGGIIIHLAVAYMMEIGGYLGNLFL